MPVLDAPDARAALQAPAVAEPTEPVAALARELPDAAVPVQQGLPEQPFSAVAERSERLSLRQRVGIS